MGKRGPKPKPSRIRDLEGNAGRVKRNRREPQPTEGRVTCPSWLSTKGKAEWKRITPELRRMRLLTIVDRAALAAYCQAYAELEEATEILNREGRIILVPITHRDKRTGEESIVGEKRIAHPANKLQRDGFTRVKQFLAEFGLTPASRAKLEGPVEETGNNDPFEALKLRAEKAG